jgi:RimJ/RimL family protein N-acetyltransferase
MALEITVRKAEATELSEVVKLFSEILRDIPYYNPLAKESEAKKYTVPKLARKLSHDPYSVLVATNSYGRIVGFSFNHFDDFTIWIDWFGVEQSSRNKGVGLAILKATLENAIKREAHKVWCDCRSSNEPSKNLLRKAGFREIAEIKNHWYKQDFILWEKFA